MAQEKPLSELEARYAEYNAAIKKFRLIDDTFMSAVFEDKTCVEVLLRIILNKDDLKVLSVKTQYSLNNLVGSSSRLDVHATDSEHKEYDIEIQRSKEGAGFKRARYYSAILDTISPDVHGDYNKLPESYVIFITESDIFKAKLPLYHIERVILETGELFEDTAHIIYVNSEIQDDTPLGKLMQDFYVNKAKDIHYSALRDRVRYFKETKEGGSNMCDIMEELYAKRAAKEKKQAAVETAQDMLADGMSMEKIAKYTHLSLDQIRELVTAN